MSTTRDQVVETTCDLLEQQGYHATGLNQIIRQSGTPKGSLYYYFPDGKEELAAEAITLTGQRLAARIQANLAAAADPAAVIAAFVRRIADSVEASAFQTGGPLTTVAMETATSSPRLNEACREAYRQLQAAFAAKLVDGGLSPTRADELAVFITAAVEGGIMLSRTHHSGDPLRRVATELERMLAEEV